MGLLIKTQTRFSRCAFFSSGGEKIPRVLSPGAAAIDRSSLRPRIIRSGWNHFNETLSIAVVSLDIVYKCNTLSLLPCARRCIAFRSPLEAALPGIFLPLDFVSGHLSRSSNCFYICHLRSAIYNSLSLYLPLLITCNNHLRIDAIAIDNSRSECPCNVLVTRFIFNPPCCSVFWIGDDNRGRSAFFYLNRI